jgi:hypothetical protein
MLVFPSLEWFQELTRLMHANEAIFKRIGPADVIWAVEVQPPGSGEPPRVFRFVFEGYGCEVVEELDPAAETDAAFTLQASFETWREMITNIQQHQGPDLQHTLNYLTLPDDPIYVKASDFLSRDLFARYGQTFQKFFDGTVEIQTEFRM